MTITRDLKQVLAMEQRFTCANIGCSQRVDGDTGHAHHAIVPRGKTNTRKYGKLLDAPENLMIVCWKCHEQHGDLSGYFMRLYYYSWKIDHGYEMAEWYAQLNMDEEMFYLGNEDK
jgi:5-methylcytosine-specific restriction endonuclease McrA